MWFSTFQLVICSMLLSPVVLHVLGYQKEDDSLSYTNGLLARVASSVNRHNPQIYNLYLEPADSGTFRNFDQEKRSRLFVGKRVIDQYPSEDGEDYVLLPSESGALFAGNEFKRNHLFVGKRGSPRFVGKRSVENQVFTRRKRFAGDDLKDLELMRGGKGISETRDLNNEDQMWKMWMANEEESSGSGKRSRMFVGKRRGFETTDTDDRQSRLFVGRRAEGEATAGDQENGSSMFFPEKEAVSEAAKRSRLFVGKRPINPHLQSPSELEENGKEIHIHPLDAGVPEPEKKARLFPGKRPAPSFVGKRQD